jgi:hypothetical protein
MRALRWRLECLRRIGLESSLSRRFRIETGGSSGDPCGIVFDNGDGTSTATPYDTRRQARARTCRGVRLHDCGTTRPRAPSTMAFPSEVADARALKGVNHHRQLGAGRRLSGDKCRGAERRWSVDR